MHHRFVILGGGLVPTQNIYLSLCRDIIFLLCLGTNPNKTGKELLYYHLYHDEAPFYLDVSIQLSNMSFIVFKSLISQ